MGWILCSSAACKKEPTKPTPEECSAIAENVSTVVGVPAMKTKLYEDCKDATPEKWETLRCLGSAKNLADLDKCKENAPAPPQSEARVNLARLFDAISSHFEAEQDGSPPHRCATKDPSEAVANSGIVPPLSVKCAAGPDGNCVPSSDPSEPWEYDASTWEDNAVFGPLRFKMDKPHRYHYAIRAKNYPENLYGACEFTAQAFGDLDDDGVVSTFERSGAADQNGVNGAAGLYIDQEME